MMQAFTPLSGSVSNVCGCHFRDRKLAAFVLSLVLFCSSFETQMRYIYQVSRKSTSGMTSRQQGTRFVSIRSNRVQSTTFSTHPQGPDALYLLSLAQIDFWYDESTARDTIRHDRSNRVQSTTFSTHPQSPDALYLLSLA